jgi:hypothetical protein
MANENSNPTIDSDNGARLDLLTEQFEALKNGLRAIESTLVNFPGMVVAALSGQPQPTIETTAHRAPTAPVERRSTGRPGRPIDPNSARQVAMRARAEADERRAAVEVKRAARVSARTDLHPIAANILQIVSKEKRVTQSDLAERLGIPRSQVRHHALELVSEGKAKAEIVKPRGKKAEVLYRAPDQVSYRKGE